LQGSPRLPNIRDLVANIRLREGVDAVIVLGHDGLLIDSQIGPGIDAEDIAARVPAIIAAGNEFGAATHRGELLTTVLEYETGLAIVSVLSSDAILLVLVSRSANVGQLLFELRRNREHIAGLV
jgi:predicted regulator of Ras-like GTPase activity (Roadblock/LC7/MglB family)